MKKILRLELCRGFQNRTFGLAVLFGVCLALYHLVDFVLPNVNAMERWVESGAYPPSLFNQWIGGAGSLSLAAFLYTFLIPCIAVIPYGESLFTDIRTGYMKMMLTKVPRRKFLTARLAAVFLTGEAACIVPLLFDLVLTAAFVPALRPDAASAQFPLTETWMFCDLFYQNPMAYILIYFVIIFLYAGLFACAGMCIGFYAENRAGIFILPFAAYTLVDFVADYFNVIYLSPHSFLDISQGARSYFSVIAAEFIIGSVVLLWIYFRKGKTYEIY